MKDHCIQVRLFFLLVFICLSPAISKCTAGEDAFAGNWVADSVTDTVRIYSSKSLSHIKNGFKLTHNRTKQVLVYRAKSGLGIVRFAWEIPAGADSFLLDSKQLSKKRMIFSSRKKQYGLQYRSGTISGKKSSDGTWILKGEVLFKKKSTFIKSY